MESFNSNHTNIEKFLLKKNTAFKIRKKLYKELFELERSDADNYLKHLRISELKARIEAEDAALRLIIYLENIIQKNIDDKESDPREKKSETHLQLVR